MAKPPMKGYLLLWGSWAGNALLTLLAAYVAFTHAGPLLPTTILTIAVCILAGNLLPLAAHGLLYSWDRLALLQDQAVAGTTLKKALSQLAQAEARLAEARDASAKGTLIARQIPDRIEEQFRQVAKALEALDAKALATLGGDLQRCIESLAEAGGCAEESRRSDANAEAQAKVLGAIRSSIDELQSVVSGMAGELGALREGVQAIKTENRKAEAEVASAPDRFASWQQSPEPEPTSHSSEEDTFGEDPDWSGDISGRADFSDEDDEEDPFSELENELGSSDPQKEEQSESTAPPPEPDEGYATGEEASLDKAAEPAEPAKKPKRSQTGETIQDTGRPPLEEFPAEANGFGDVPSDDSAGDKDVSVGDDPSDSENDSSGEDAGQPPKKKAATKAVRKKAKPAKEKEAGPPELFSEDEIAVAKPARAAGTILEAHAMIGLQNKLYLRGDPPHLDWDAGVPLELTGIGEYRWAVENLKYPLNCKLLLNDERWAIGANLLLKPGETLVAHPKF